jgi:hypothetical protein
MNIKQLRAHQKLDRAYAKRRKAHKALDRAEASVQRAAGELGRICEQLEKGRRT